MKTLFVLLNLLRVKQWVKNTFIFFPLLFAEQFFSFGLLKNAALAFLSFCLISSGLYILNDLLDKEKDRLHPKKSKRPLAKKNINLKLIYPLILTLLLAGLAIAGRIDQGVAAIAFLFIVVHLIYNFYTKHIVLLDVFFIAIGFQLRIWAGALACDVFPSVWLQMCVFILALFLGFTKRRCEILILKEKAPEHRSVLSHYTAYMLDQMIIICSTLAVVFYGLYAISPEIMRRTGNQQMVYSVAFVIYGIFRYLYLVHVKKMGDEPGELLLSDWPLLICVLLWIGYVGLVIYG